MKKKSGTRNIIIVMLVLTVVISLILVAVNIMSAQVNGKAKDVTSQRESVRIADEIQYMAQSADLGVKYYSSDQRVGVYFVGREGFYQLQYNSSTGKLYLCEGSYTSTATTDELKLSEATYNNSGLQPYADNVSSFAISGADSNGNFPSGEMSVSFNVEVNGTMNRSDVKIQIPQEVSE